MKRLNKKMLFFSLILALITTLVAYRYLTNTKSSISNKKYVNLIVAAVNIPARTKITPKMIKEIKVPEGSYILNSIQNKDEIIGMYSKSKILEGEVIPQERLIKEEKKDLALRIPEGKRAISISVDEISGVGDLIKSGDYVDVFLTLDEITVDSSYSKTIYPQITKLLFQNVEVLAIGKEMNRTENVRKETPNKYSVTLAVSAMEAEKFVLAEDMGRFKLALRPQGDEKIYNTAGAVREDLVPEKGKRILSK